MTYLTVIEQQQIFDIYSCLGLPDKFSKAAVKQMAAWEQAKGIKWLVNYLKALRSFFLSGEKSPTFGLHKDGTVRGVFRYLSRLAARDRKGSITADVAIRIYGRWESLPITNEDYRGFKASVEITPELDRDVPLILSPALLKAARQHRSAQFNKQLPTSKIKRVPFIGKTEFNTHPNEHYLILQDKCPNLLRKHLHFFETHIFENSMSELGDTTFGFHFEEGADCLQFDVAGRIAGLTKDRGLKKRFIANPHRFLQMATSRLQQAADRTLQGIKVSMVHDQSKSEDWVRDQLGQGKRLFSLDLSSATDHFPLWYQEKVARSLFPGLMQDINLWLDICRLLWELPISDPVLDAEFMASKPKFLISRRTEEVRYTKGQPMGTAPSFAIFTLSHIALAYSLGGTDENFAVIGDDIVISDEDLALKYQSYMKKLGVSISLSKSLLNDSKAEFAGRIIDRHGYWPSFKSSPIDVIKDPFGAFRQFGLRGKQLVRPKWADMLEQLAKIPFVGPRRCWDFSVLESMSPEAVLEIYRNRAVLYSKFEPRPVDMFRHFASMSGKTVKLDAGYHYQQQFEEANLESGGFKGVIGNPENRDPMLVEHVNSMLLQDNLSEKGRSHLLELQKSLGKGSNPSYRESEVSPPFAYLVKLDKLLSK